jgi:hypothetical protein
LQLDPQGNLFNIYRDEQGQRTITPVGNISQMQRFKVGGCTCTLSLWEIDSSPSVFQACFTTNRKTIIAV